MMSIHKQGNTKTDQGEEGEKENGLHFRFLENVQEITGILKERLPKSANIYNMSRVYSDFKKPEEMAFYVMCVDNEEDGHKPSAKMTEAGTWVLVTYFREDYGMRYALSAPIKNVEITAAIKKAFAESQYINWNEHYHFSCIDFEISPMIWEISTKVFGNSVTSMPCKIFVTGNEQAADIQVDVPEKEKANFELESLSKDVEKGTRFICQTWKYSVPQKTDLAIEKLLRKNKSVGLFSKSSGEIVCGMLTNDCGLMGMLHTVPEQRGKGYATLVTRKLMKSLAVENGAVPCSAVEMRNHQSIKFHEKLGMSCSHYADFIKYVPQTWS